MSAGSQEAIHERPAELLRDLIRFDTTNPPGNEAECIGYIEGLIRQAGLETRSYSKDPARPNLFARLQGRGSAPPLLLYGHVDVVTTLGQQWTHPPFEGAEADGYIWGRGALDMKGGVAMMLAAFLRAQAQGLQPAGDVIFSAMCDEEAMSGFGAKWLAQEHPELFDGVRYAISEFGGFAHELSGKRFYPIQVAEKQICTLRATVRGRPGHGSTPVRDGAMRKLARALERLTSNRLPVHLTPVVEQMIDAFADGLGGPRSLLLRQLKRTALTDRILDLLGDRSALLDPLLHNTASPTMISASDKVNVIPAEVSLVIDARILPGMSPEELIGEVGELIGRDIALEVVHYDPGAESVDMALYPLLAEILERQDPAATATPLLMPGVSDARFLAPLGIQTYGFLPMNLSPDFDFWKTVHGADERVPARAIEFGARAIYSALERYKVTA